MEKTFKRQPGPFRTEQLRSGDAYELSRGHPILREPTGGRGSRANRAGAQVLGTDPADERELQDEISELLAAGTQWVWGVRLGMPRQAARPTRKPHRARCRTSILLPRLRSLSLSLS